MKTQSFYKDGDQLIIEMQVVRTIEYKTAPLQTLYEWMEEFFKEERQFYFKHQSFDHEAAYEDLTRWMVDQFYFDTYLKPVVMRRINRKLENPKQLVNEILNLVK